MTSVHRRAGWLLTAAALIAIAALTLQPRPELAPLSEATRLWCLVCGSHGLVDVILNVLLFVPLGAGLALAGVRPSRAVLLAAAVTLSIELLQLRAIAGRDASLSDLLTNTLGAGAGLALVRHARGLVLPPPAAARRLLVLWAAVLLAVSAGTAVSLAPSMPPPPYWGQWTPELGGMLQHDGRVHAARVEDIAVPGHRLEASAALADRLRDGELSARVEATVAGPTARTAPIFRLVNDRGQQLLLVAQDGTDLVVQTGTRSERFRLRAVTVRVPGALPAGGGEVGVDVASDRRGYRIGVEQGGAALDLSVRRDITWGWALLLPFAGHGARGAIAGILWVATLLMPAGWWSGRARVASVLLLGAVLAVLAAAFVGLPLALAMPVAGARAWAGAVAGLVLGRLAAGWLGQRVDGPGM